MQHDELHGGADNTALRGPSQAQCAAMAQDGFLLVRGFFEQPVIEDLLRWTAELSAAPEVPGRHWVYYEDSLTEPGKRVVQRIENFCPFHRGFDRLIRAGELSRWAGALMGGPVVLFKEKINFKMRGAPGFKAHQDQQAGWSRYAPLFVTVLVTIDPATLENGCLEIARGRHRHGLLGEEWKPLPEDGLDLQPVPTMPGDVIFFEFLRTACFKTQFCQRSPSDLVFDLQPCRARRSPGQILRRQARIVSARYRARWRGYLRVPGLGGSPPHSAITAALVRTRS